MGDKIGYKIVGGHNTLGEAVKERIVQLLNNPKTHEVSWGEYSIQRMRGRKPTFRLHYPGGSRIIDTLDLGTVVKAYVKQSRIDDILNKSRNRISRM